MAVEKPITSHLNTCVLLAPADVDIGKHVTDAVRAGGWELERTDRALDAMLKLCQLERARREHRTPHAGRHMLLLHRDLHVDVLGALSAAVAKHLPDVKVHEIQAAPQQKTPKTAHAPQPNDDDESPVVGRIGATLSAAALASMALEQDVASLQREEDEQVADVDADEAPEAPEESAELRAPHEVTRDEIAMLLSDETGLPPRPGKNVDSARHGERG